MQPSCLSIFSVLVTLLCLLCEARHVPLNSQRGGGGQSRPRLLVIRPPPGSNQRKRVIVLSNPRFLKSDKGSTDMTRVDPSRASLPASIPGLTTLQESPPPTDIPSDNGGHPQSQARKKDGPKSNTRSLRNLIEVMNNQRKARQESSNIARISDSVPRAAPPVMPTDNRFGDLNIPRVIEAALKRAQDKSRFMGNVRPLPHGHSHSHSHSHGDGGHHHADVLDITDLSLHNSAQAREFAKLKSRSDPRLADSSSSRGSGLRSFGSETVNRSGRRRGNIGSHSHHASHSTHAKTEHPMSSKTNTAQQQVQQPSPKIQTNLTDPSLQNIATNGNPNPVAKPVLTANITAKVDAASTNTSSNTTSTKSVKTKTIKVTTVVKGGTAADVAAAAASQAEIAQAVAQGNNLNSSAIAEITKSAVEKRLHTTPPPGSITVKRQNGISVITLADGVGDPVVIRATGPVKIERIVKPDGKVQFVINPVLEPATKVTHVTTAVPTSAEKEVEAEDITTTYAPTSIIPITQYETSTSVAANILLNNKIPVTTTLATNVIKEENGLSSNVAAELPVTNQQVKAVDPTHLQGNSKTNNANNPLLNFSPYDTPRIPRPPPRIPRPPKLSDMFLRDQGLLDPLAAATLLAASSGENGPLQMPQFESSTNMPMKLSSKSSNDAMPQYEILQHFKGDVIL